MSTRANIVIKYYDRRVGVPSELWLYRHRDGYVRGIGEDVVRAVHDYGRYVEDGTDLNGLWDRFPGDFENVAVMREDVEFLYRVTYAGDAVTVVARHDSGGHVDEYAHQGFYPRLNDSYHSVELYRAVFSEDKPFWNDIREPESYVATLGRADQQAARSWRGKLG